MNDHALFICLLFLAIGMCWIAWEFGAEQRRRRRYALNAALFRPKIIIDCRDAPAEAGSSRTPGSLSRSNA